MFWAGFPLEQNTRLSLSIADLGLMERELKSISPVKRDQSGQIRLTKLAAIRPDRVVC